MSVRLQLPPFPRLVRQHGAALFVVLIFMMVFGLFVAGGLRSAWLSARVARHQIDRLLAYQAALAALRDAERDLDGKAFDGSPCAAGQSGCRPYGHRPIAGPGGAGLSFFDERCGSVVSTGQCARNENDYFAQPVWRDPALLERAALYGSYTRAQPLPDVARQPRYLIEAFDKASGLAFRITALGYGANVDIRVTLQSLYFVADLQ